MRRFLTKMRRYLVNGMLTLLPVTVTVWVLLRLFTMLDAWSAAFTTYLFGRRIPGAGLVVTLAVLLVVGAIATNVLGRKLLSAFENVMARLPLVRGIYSAARQLVDTFASPQKAAFKKVVLIEYPRVGVWSVGFITADPSPTFSQMTGRDLVTVFVPTTPNPTSGFFLAVPREDCMILNMSVESAFKLIVSGGAIEPGAQVHFINAAEEGA